MRHTAIRGHGLIGEGVAWEWVDDYDGRGRGAWITPRPDRFTGVGRCKCGAVSGELRSNASRRRWHNNHKAKVIAASRTEGTEG